MNSLSVTDCLIHKKFEIKLTPDVDTKERRAKIHNYIKTSFHNLETDMVQLFYYIIKN